MSWNVDKTGTPEEVVKALEEQSNTLTDQSKEEYDAVLPHLVALIKENVGGHVGLSAWGCGVKNPDGSYADKNCQVTLSRF
jgi:hypothetical protein